MIANPERQLNAESDPRYPLNVVLHFRSKDRLTGSGLPSRGLAIFGGGDGFHAVDYTPTAQAPGLFG